MKPRSTRLALPLSLVAFAIGAVAQAQAGGWSDFSVNDEGWLTASMPDNGPFNATPISTHAVTYETSGGLSGPYISSPDPDSVTFWFQAPAEFLGNQSATYGQTISFDLRHVSAGAAWDAPDIALVSPSGVLVADLGPNPTRDTWLHYSIGLTEASGWHVGTLTGPVPTQTEFQTVLSLISEFRIRGEYAYNDETTSLDNVQLGAVPEPAETALGGGVALVGWAAWRRSRRARR